MNLENELAELDQKEYQKLKRIIVRNKDSFKGLGEKQKLNLLAGWIDDIKEERLKKEEEPEKLISIVAEEETKAEPAEKTPEIEVVEDEYKEEKKSSWFKVIAAVFVLLLIIAACVIGTLYLLRDTGDVKFSNIKDKTIDENEELEIEFKTKNAETIDVYNMPEGSRFEDTTFVWTPNYEQAGIYNISAIAYNNQSNISQEFKITVRNVNRPPRITSANVVLSVYTGQKVPFTVQAEDDDNDKLSYTWYFGFEKYKGTDTMYRTFTTEGRKTVKVKVCDKEDCAANEWKLTAFSYAPEPIEKKTYVVSEVVVGDEYVAKEETEPLTTYVIVESDKDVDIVGDEIVEVIPTAEETVNESYKINTYEIVEGEDEEVIFIEPSEESVNTYIIE
ncbi:PKD domain-containing protein [Candidatus Woesearchaeota archaeon]|nr:PKD domain-containing protein [Candidatus Woesearchaeota archaeon]